MLMSLFHAGPFKVTIVAHKIVQLMASTVQDALGSSSTAVVQSTCNGVLEVASLFIAVPDPRLQQQLQQASTLCSASFNSLWSDVKSMRTHARVRTDVCTCFACFAGVWWKWDIGS